MAAASVVTRLEGLEKWQKEMHSLLLAIDKQVTELEATIRACDQARCSQTAIATEPTPLQPVAPAEDIQAVGDVNEGCRAHCNVKMNGGGTNTFSLPANTGDSAAHCQPWNSLSLEERLKLYPQAPALVNSRRKSPNYSLSQVYMAHHSRPRRSPNAPTQISNSLGVPGLSMPRNGSSSSSNGHWANAVTRDNNLSAGTMSGGAHNFHSGGEEAGMSNTVSTSAGKASPSLRHNLPATNQSLSQARGPPSTMRGASSQIDGHRSEATADQFTAKETEHSETWPHGDTEAIHSSSTLPNQMVSLPDDFTEVQYSPSHSSPVSRGPSPPRVLAAIDHTRNVGFGLRQHTVYHCVAYDRAGMVLEADRRYNDFVMLRNVVRWQYPKLKDLLPPLPEKRMLGKLQSTVVEQRRLGLQTFLQFVASHPALQHDEDLLLKPWLLRIS